MPVGRDAGWLSDAAQNFANLLNDCHPGPIGIAVSGGGDSMALLRIAHDLKDREIFVATVDHNLRDGSASEAEQVAQWCQDLGLSHETLRWNPPQNMGNLQDAARGARRSLLTEWATRLNLSAICLGHTQDDQAETFLLRLARGSGVDGLASMYPTQTYADQTWLRPLLGVSRDDLRAYLSDIGQDWIDDPSNNDPQFDRIKMRQAKDALTGLGLTADRLARTANHMQDARLALELAAQAAAEKCMTATDYGSVVIDRAAFSTLTSELKFRTLAHALGWVAPTIYRPRFDGLQNMLTAIEAGKGHTLAGCQTQFVERTNSVEITREPNAVKTGLRNGLFDNKWRSLADIPAPLNVAPLGEKGLLLLDDWRELNISRRALTTTPAIWDGIGLIAAPIAGRVLGYSFELESSVHEFLTTFVTH